jgi:hypothetical protein
MECAAQRLLSLSLAASSSHSRGLRLEPDMYAPDRHPARPTSLIMSYLRIDRYHIQ